MNRSLRITAACMAVGAVVRVCWADTFPAQFTGFLNSAADGSVMTACWDDSGAAPTELLDHLDFINSTISLSTNLRAEFLDSCEAGTDWKLHDDYPHPTNWGLSTCTRLGGDFSGSVVAISDLECEEWDVQISLTNVNAADCSGITDSQLRRKVWTHETGHAMGLGHENSAMAQGCTSSSTYSAHHLTHLDDYR